MTVSYPRRQQYRRLRSAGTRAAQTGVALAAAALCARDGQAALAATLVAPAAVHAMSSRRALRLAARSRLGAKSEAQVRRELDALVREGWHVRHSVDWPMPGDIDHVVRAPTGIALVIETKTLRHTRDHLRRTKAAAAWIARGRRRYPHGVLPVLCVTRVRRVEHMEAGVLIVSLDRLLLALRATTSRRPARPLRAQPRRVIQSAWSVPWAPTEFRLPAGTRTLLAVVVRYRVSSQAMAWARAHPAWTDEPAPLLMVDPMAQRASTAAPD